MSKDVTRLLEKYKDVFPDNLPKGLPPSRGKDFSIELIENAKPQCRGLYRMSLPELEEVKKKVDELIEHGFIRPSTSPWGAPVLFAIKKDGGLRFCVDYRALNRLTVKNGYPLPRIDEMLDKLCGARYFTKIDLLSGYHQMKIDEKSIPKTAFKTKYGSFEFTVVPFGLTNAPGFFMSNMNQMLSDFIDVFVLVYLDDILVYSETWKDHLTHIENVLKRLRENRFYAKKKKCVFGVKEIEYLGFILRDGSIHVDPSKIEAVKAWTRPSCKKDVQSFLGMVNFYRRFIKNCSNISKPLTELTKNVMFQWGDVQEKAFIMLKNCLTSAPVLRYFDPKCPIIITTDASKFALGAVMEQVFSDGTHPVAFLSKTLNAAEQNYAPHNSEMLGIVYAITSWHCYLHGQKFVIQTDHDPLKHFFTQKKLSALQVRWLEKIINYDFVIKPIRGKTNRVADALSRQQAGNVADDAYPKGLLRDFENRVFKVQNISVIKCTRLQNEIYDGYLEDAQFQKTIRKPKGKYVRKGNLLYYNNRLCIPDIPLRKSILHDFHDLACSGHLGERKTRHRVSRLYYWKTLRKDVQDYVASCYTCQRTKAKNKKPYGLLQPIDPPKQKWSVITMDFVGPLPKTKNGYTSILNVIDKLS